MENTTTKEGSLIMAMIWMAVLSMLLFWLPLLGPLIAGFAGGYTAGSASNGVLAALIPVFILCVLLFAFSTALTGLPVIGIVFGLGAFAIMVVQALPLLAGAIIGGLVA